MATTNDNSGTYLLVDGNIGYDTECSSVRGAIENSTVSHLTLSDICFAPTDILTTLLIQLIRNEEKLCSVDFFDCFGRIDIIVDAIMESKNVSESSLVHASSYGDFLSIRKATYERFLPALGRGIRNNQRLVSLELDGLEFTADRVEMLMSGLAERCKDTSITVTTRGVNGANGNDISGGDGNDTSASEESPPLIVMKQISFWDCQFEHESHTTLAEYLHHIATNSLDFVSCKLRDEQVSEIIMSLVENSGNGKKEVDGPGGGTLPFLQELDLYQNQCGDQTMAALTELLTCDDCRLKCIDLSLPVDSRQFFPADDEKEDTYCRNFFQALANSSTMEELKLVGHDISLENLKCLAKSLRHVAVQSGTGPSSLAPKTSKLRSIIISDTKENFDAVESLRRWCRITVGTVQETFFSRPTDVDDRDRNGGTQIQQSCVPVLGLWATILYRILNEKELPIEAVPKFGSENEHFPPPKDDKKKDDYERRDIIRRASVVFNLLAHHGVWIGR